MLIKPVDSCRLFTISIQDTRSDTSSIEFQLYYIMLNRVLQPCLLMLESSLQAEIYVGFRVFADQNNRLGTNGCYSIQKPASTRPATDAYPCGRRHSACIFCPGVVDPRGYFEPQSLCETSSPGLLRSRGMAIQ